jgi:hypothetical protein
MVIPDPHFLLSYPGSNNNKRRRANKFVDIPFWVAMHFTKLKNIFLKRYNKVLSYLTKNFSNFNPKIVTKLSEIWFGDPRSGIREKFSCPDQVVKKAPDPGSRSTTLS